MSDLEPIAAFRSPDEYRRFVHFIEAAVERGDLVEVPMNPQYHLGELYGGRWFKCPIDNSVWRLIPPDVPFLGVFERVVN